MAHFEEKVVVQAVLIADNNKEDFRPFSDNNSTALLPLVNVALLDYSLEALNRSGIEEVFVYSSLFRDNVKAHIKRGIVSKSSWSVNMTVNVIGGDGCRCFGDAIRDIDAKALIRGNFILLCADTIMNIDLKSILEEHKKTVKYDKGAAATLIFKEATARIRTGNEVMIVMDTQNRRLHHHQRLRLNNKESHFEVPLEIFINNSQIAVMHNIIDPQIAIGSPSMLSLFSDNFDFETRDDFVRGILINEEILDSRIYVSLLLREQYARKVNNWLSYQIVSQDIINRWVYPLVPDMGIHCLSQKYIYLRNNIYKSPEATVAKASLQENVVVHAGTSIESGSIASCCVIGANCRIGRNCILSNAFLMDDVTIAEGCTLQFCVVESGAVIGANSVLSDGTIVGESCVVPPKSVLSKLLIKSTDKDEEDVCLEKLGGKAFVVDAQKGSFGTYGSDSEDEIMEAVSTGVPKMSKLPVTCVESDYTSSSDDDVSQPGSPILDDTNIFLLEVMDSLARGFREKSNPNFLILEINSSRYAYNMSLKEVNFYVVKAIFSLQNIKAPTNNNVLITINQVLKQLGPVMKNYIKTEDAMMDCLKALQEICEENSHIKEKISQLLHYLYDKDFVTEDAILAWYGQLNDQDSCLRNELKKLVDWLNQSSDDGEEED